MKEDLGQVVRHAEMQQVPHWSFDQHEHRQELTQNIHEATEGVASTEVKPRKPYVTDAILEVLVTERGSSKLSTERRNKSNVLAGREYLPFGERSPIGLQGTSARRMFHLTLLGISNFTSTTLNMALMLTKVSGRERCKQALQQEKPRLPQGDTNGSNKVISRKPCVVIWTTL